MSFNKFVIGFAAIFLLLPIGAFARSKDSGSLNLASAAQLGGTRLKAGSYQVRWSGNAKIVNVDVLKNNKSVATSQARIIELPSKSAYNEIQTNTKTNQIQQIDFSGRREALAIQPS
jgi:hypothetical protein